MKSVCLRAAINPAKVYILERLPGIVGFFLRKTGPTPASVLEDFVRSD